jgi:hypothetical protein
MIEWGNPNKREEFGYMLKYSPYDNVKAQKYPSMLVQVSLNDSQVPYWEGAKWAAKLRALKTDTNPLLLKTNMAPDMAGRQARYDALAKRRSRMPTCSGRWAWPAARRVRRNSMTALLLAVCIAAAAPPGHAFTGVTNGLGLNLGNRSLPGRSLGEGWKRLRSEHFVAVGDADYEPMRNILVELEGFRQALLRSSPGLRIDSSTPTTVVIFKDEASFSRFRPRDEDGRRRETVAAYLLSGPDANYLVVPSHRNASRTFHYLFHEYTHLIVRQTQANAPEWLNEGLAEFYSTFRASPRDGRSVLGEPPQNRLPLLNSAQRMPLRELLTMGPGERARADTRRQQMFYAQSWALVHYLTLGDGGRHRPGIAAYLAALEQGQSLETAIESAFGMSLAVLEEAAARYAQRSAFPRQEMQEPREGVRMRTSLEALTPDEAAAFQAALLAILHPSSSRHQDH